MADRPRRPWAAADDDVLYEVVRRIPCEIDRRRMSRICHSWRVALRRVRAPAPPPPLPWLLLPRAGGRPPTFSCALSGFRTHPFLVPRGAHRAHYFGSYDGEWVFLAVDGQGNQAQEYPRRVAQDHVLVNLNNFHYFNLPNRIRFGAVVVYPSPRHWYYRKMAIVAATLSCKPTEQGCIVAGFLEYFPFPGHAEQHVAFWRIGDDMVLPPFWEGMNREADWFRPPMEDLIFYGGAFLFLDRGEHILACEERPVFQEYGVELVPVGMFFQPRVHDKNETVLARYLVESRKNLLMVVKLTSGRQHLPTSAFRVFQKKKLNNGEEDEPLYNGMFQFQYYWSELDKLEGRMLFVGRGCSRSYEAGDRYSGMEEGVYFLDDRSFRKPIMAFDRDADELPYRCSDNGKWSKSPSPHVDRCFPARGPSIDSPPVWILP
ncbi:uncharacterized protein LOC127772486 [Oryza glaberrima]|uniref:uncharacterized protein LOC127772486 n=1 Tax=Oryza glaberrima TaxID=4538 RepID=UPI00224C48C5|nr:uncharacterized protein LOC127772486 [Oryza glaberrima]